MLKGIMSTRFCIRFLVDDFIIQVLASGASLYKLTT
jgi:hypothetical protein